jgi:hypothetical protein
VSISLVDELRRQVLAALTTTTSVSCDWSTDGSRLRFPRQDDSGFDVEVHATEHEIVVQAIGVHEHFEIAASSGPEVCVRVLGLVRDLLSPDMRIREVRAGDKPVRWFMESFSDGRWSPEAETGLLFFNYISRRTERI